jgi:hypothetical protein
MVALRKGFGCLQSLFTHHLPPITYHDKGLCPLSIEQDCQAYSSELVSQMCQFPKRYQMNRHFYKKLAF